MSTNASKVLKRHFNNLKYLNRRERYQQAKTERDSVPDDKYIITFEVPMTYVMQLLVNQWDIMRLFVTPTGIQYEPVGAGNILIGGFTPTFTTQEFRDALNRAARNASMRHLLSYLKMDGPAAKMELTGCSNDWVLVPTLLQQLGTTFKKCEVTVNPRYIGSL